MPDELPAPCRARATVRQPTPGRPRTATRSGSAAAARSPLPAGRRSWWRIAPARRRKSGALVRASPTRSVRSEWWHPRRRGASQQLSATRRRQLLGINLTREATPGADGPPWTNACATRGRATSRHTGGIGPAPQHEHPVAAVGDLQGPTRDLGATLAGAWPPGATSIPARDTGGYPCLVWP